MTIRNLISVWLLASALGCSGATADPKETTAGGNVLEGVVFPDEEWQTLTPEEAFSTDYPSISTGTTISTDLGTWKNFVSRVGEKIQGTSFQGEDHSGNQWGAAIVWRGYLLQTFGDPDYRFQTASFGKSLNMACLQLAIDEGLIKSADDLIQDYWTGEGQLNGAHKYMNAGFHAKLTFRHLANHTGGFPLTNGFTWANCKNYEAAAPAWSNCTGDPDHDNYAHVEPGSMAPSYSSGGYWRLNQALTAVWKKNLKAVLDEKLFSKMGIPADRWDWMPGQKVRDNELFYPQMPGYGKFVDPPYEIDGNIVNGGGGWVVMSAKDLARFGLLIATRGIWKGERLISDTEWLRSHAGGNASFAGGIGGDTLVAFGKVAAEGIGMGDIPLQVFAGRRPKPSQQHSSQQH